LECLAQTAGQRQRKRDQQHVRRQPPVSFMPPIAPHIGIPLLCPSAACRTPEIGKWQFSVFRESWLSFKETSYPYDLRCISAW
jgi:hypothetical protein